MTNYIGEQLERNCRQCNAPLYSVYCQEQGYCLHCLDKGVPGKTYMQDSREGSNMVNQAICRGCAGPLTSLASKERQLCFRCLSTLQAEPQPERDMTQEEWQQAAAKIVSLRDGMGQAIKEARMQEQPRPSWDEYYLTIATDVAARASCPAGHVGAVIVSAENVIIMTGYNGSPTGITHCTELGCSWVSRTGSDGSERSYARHVHAEANAIARAARVGVRLNASTLYVTQEPCPDCLKLCLQAGIRVIVAGTVKDRNWWHEAVDICNNASVVLRERQ